MSRYDVRSLYEETFGVEEEEKVAATPGATPLPEKKYNVRDLYAETFGQPRTEHEDLAPAVNRWAASAQLDDPERVDKAHKELRAYLGEDTPPVGLLTLQQAEERLRVAQMDHATQGAPYTAKWAVQRAGENRAPYDLPGLARVEKSYGALLKDFFSKPIMDTGSTAKLDTTNPLYTYVAGPGAIIGHVEVTAPEPFKRVVQAAPSDITAVGPLRLLSGFQGAYAAILENSVPASLLNTLATAITGTNVISEHHKLGDAIGRLADDIADDMPEDASLTERGFRSGFQSMGQTLPLLLTAPLAGKGAVNLFSGAMGASAGGQTYLRNYEKYQDPQRAALHGILDGTAEYVFERLGGEAVLLDKAAWAKGFFGGVAKFIAREVPSEMATTFVQNVNDWALMNPEKSVEEFLSEQGDAQIETIIATLVGGGGQIAVVKGIEAAANAVGRSAQAKQEERQITELFAASTEARLFNSDPEAFDAFMQGIAPDAAVRIDATVLSQAMESAGIDASTMPSVLEQGDLPGEIEVPMTELIKAFAGTPAESEVIQNIRLDPEAQTIKERRDLGDRALEEFKRIGSKTLEAKKADDRFTGSLTALREEIEADLEATGVYKPGATSAFAEAVSLTYATTAARMGITPVQLRDGWTDAKGVQHRGYNLLARSEKAGEVRRAAPPATKADFTPGRVQNVLRRDNWAVVTAENPKGVTISPEENAARNELLRAELQARGLRFQEATGKELITEQVVGKYAEEGQEKTAPLEHPFLVLGLDSATALEIGRKFEQDSVITKDGLIFHDGTRYAPENVTEHTEEPANYWTRVPSTGAMFTINLDFSAKVPWENVDSTTAGTRVPQGMRHAVVESLDLRGDGRSFEEFFSAASSGLRAPDIQPEPVIDISAISEFSEEYNKHRGNFDDHIAASIPGFREVQQAVGYAVSRILAKGSVLDVGASEGAWIKAVSAVTNGAIETVGLDPNPAMSEHFTKHSQIPGSTYATEAFGSKADEGKVAWTEGDTDIKFFKPDRLFDVIHEAMVFQFISNGRNAQVARTKEMLAPGGLALFEEKIFEQTPKNPTPEQLAALTPAQQAYLANEKQKDEYKARHFSATALEAKKKEVLEKGTNAAEQASRQEQAATGMNDLMPTAAELEYVLRKNFKHVVQYWDSGNFKGFAASDNQATILKFLRELPDLNSEFSTVPTPEVLQGMDTLDQRTSETVMAEALEVMRKIGEIPPGEQTAKKEKLNAKFQKLIAERKKRMDAEYEAARQGSLFQSVEGRAPVTVTGIHFSQEPRTSLAPSAYGRGIDGAERERVMAATDPRLKRRTHFYVNTGMGIFPEQYVGAHAHVANLTNLYDADVDALGLFKGKTAAALNAAESGVLDAGYSGYLMRSFGNQGAAVVFQPSSIDTTPVGGLKEALALATVAPAPKFSATQKLKMSILANARKLPGGMMPVESWDRMLAKMLPEQHAVLKAGGVFERATGSLYLDELLRFVEPPAGAFYQRVDFFSPLARAFETAKQESMPSGQWASWLNGNKAKLGLKDDELQWSGILDYLELRGKDKVTKAEIADYLSGNGVVVNTVEKGNQDEKDTARELLENAGYVVEDDGAISRENEDGDLESVDGWNLPTRELKDAAALLQDAAEGYAGGSGVNATKFSGYWDSSYKGGIPGTYRETLVTLPPAGEKTYAIVVQEGGKPLVYRFNGVDYPTAQDAKAAEDAARRAEFKSAHWNEPNVLVHLRTDEVMGADGERYLRVGEIQSDWGQKGKKEGFDTKGLPPGYRVEKIEVPNPLQGLGGNNVKTVTRFVVLSDTGAVATQQFKTEEGAVAAYLQGRDSVPAAPFVTDTRAWVALGIKQAIRQAIDAGVDGIVFGTGEQNANLYSLERQVNSIDYAKEGNGTYSLMIAMKDGENVQRDGQTEADLEELVGKDVAAKIVNNEGKVPGYPAGAGVLSGEGLKVQATGMRAFYDKIVPQVTNEVLKKLGGGKVGRVAFPDENSAETARNLTAKRSYLTPGSPRFRELTTKIEELTKKEATQPGFEITDAMREALTAKGMPLFQNPQQARGQFSPETLEYTLLAKADLSTFMHEMAHFYLTMQSDLALQIEQRVAAGEEISAGEQSILDDMNTALEWMGVTASTPAGGATGGVLSQAAFDGPETGDTPIGDLTEIEVDGIVRPALNNLGRPIHPTQEGVRNFWRWFGDSKVVDGQGRPRVVYHGSTRGGIRFSTVQNSFFSSDENVARTYSEDDYYAAEGGDPVVQSAYLRADNVLAVDAAGEPWMRIPFEGGRATTDQLANIAKKRGYDGVVVANVEDNVNDEELPPSSVFITLGKRTQIKSATGNRGTFAADDANILFQDGSRLSRGDVTKNAGGTKLRALVDRAEGGYLRGLFTPRGDLLVWDAALGTHSRAAEVMGLPYDVEARASVRPLEDDDFGVVVDAGVEKGVLANLLRDPFVYFSVSGYGLLSGPEFAGTDAVLRQGLQDGQPQAAGPLPAGTSALEVWSKMSLEQQRPFHEKYAETFEQYLLTGKAPTKKLESLFRRLADWMRRVYLDMKRFLQQRNLADLNPEISAVFDRLVATEQEIAEAVAQREHEALFKNAVEAGMTPDQYAEYIGLPDDAKLEAEAQLRARSMRDMKWMQNRRNKTIAALQADAKEKRAAIKAEVTAEVAEEPVYQAIRWLRHGIMVNPDTKEEIQALKGHKLHAPALAEMFPEGAIEGAPDWKKLGYGKYGMLAAEGIHPDMLAEMFGYRSGQELVGALLNAPNIKDEIEGITDQRMLERYGDLATPEGIAKAADEAMVNDVRLRMLATELSRLAAHLGSPATIMRAAKAYAKVLVDSRVVKKLKPRAYSADATRAGKQATAAWAKGNAEEAAGFKRTEILNHVTAAEAYEAEKEIKKITDRLTKIANVKDDDSAAKSRNMDVVNATRVVLASFGFGSTKKGENAKQYLDALKLIEPEIGAAMEELVLIATADAKNWQNLTVAELRELHGMVTGVWSLAKRSREIEIDGKRISRELVADELVAQAQKHDPRPAKDIGAKHAITAEEERKSLFSTLKAQFRRINDWAEAIDGGKTIGPFRRYIWFPVKDAADRYRADKVKYLKAYRELLKPLSNEFGKGLIDARELDYVFGKGDGVGGLNELLHAILHTGNESNKRKMLLGRGWAVENEDGSLDTSKWDKFIARMHREGVLQKRHYDFAQGVWDLLESTKINAQKAHRAVFGKSFAEVTADAFTTPFGNYAGGYVPAMADSRIVQDAQLRNLANQENENMAYAMPTPARGFTMSRVEYNRPLMLDLRTLAGHIDKVLLFSHLAEPAADVRRILMDKRVSAEINRIDSAALTSMLTPWLSRAAKQVIEVKKPGAEQLGRFWSAARSRAGMAAMFANVVNTAQQITGFATAAVKVGPGYLLRANAKYLANPMEATKFVTENSPYIAERIQQGSMAMVGEVTEILVNPSTYEAAKEWTRRHAYFMQTAVDGVMSPIIWLGAYQQALDNGASHQDASRLGDEAVRQTQGSQLPEEVANFEVGSPFYRMFTQFAGYFNSQANMLGTEFSKVAHEMGLRKGLGRGFYILVLGMLAPAIASEMIVQAFRGGPDDEDKDGEYLDDWISAMFVGTARYMVAMFPGVGPSVMALVNTFNHKPYDDRISTAPAISMVETAVRAPISVYKAWAEDETGKPGKAIMDTATAVSMLVGVPVRAIAKPIAYAADVEAGYIEPVDEMDYTRGLITGFASPESKQ